MITVESFSQEKINKYRNGGALIVITPLEEAGACISCRHSNTGTNQYNQGWVKCGLWSIVKGEEHRGPKSGDVCGLEVNGGFLYELYQGDNGSWETSQADEVMLLVFKFDDLTPENAVIISR